MVRSSDTEVGAGHRSALDHSRCRCRGSENSWSPVLTREERRAHRLAHMDADAQKQVAKLVSEKMYQHYLAQFLYDQAHGVISPRPRDPWGDTDLLEQARIRKLAEARDFKALVDRKVMEHKAAQGTAEYIDVPAVVPPRRQWLEGASVKDAPDLEFRDGPV